MINYLPSEINLFKNEQDFLYDIFSIENKKFQRRAQNLRSHILNFCDVLSPANRFN